jgi:pimeloyl-ACP methyl ester carboxylesterase
MMGSVDTIVLVHGLWRTHLSFLVPYLRLPREGFKPVGIRYPARTRPLDELAQHVAARLPRPAAGRLHFLTHSLGGLVVRRLLRDHRPPNLGRVVMLSPPNQGSQLARRLQHSRFFRVAAGPVGLHLASDAEALNVLLGPVDYELGVIVGSVTRGLGRSMIEGPSDGRVSVEEARVDGMLDFLVVRCGHMLIMNNAAVLDQAVHFFRHGMFRHEVGIEMGAGSSDPASA